MSDPPKASNPTAAQKSWLENHRNVTVVLAYVLTVLYVSPVIVCTLALVATDGFMDGHLALSWFAAFTAGHEKTLSEFHKILLPVMAAMATASFYRASPVAIIGLVCTILVLFVWTVLLSVYFDVPETKTKLDGILNDFSMDSPRMFFTRVREMLITFVMMLLGIQIANTSENKRSTG